MIRRLPAVIKRPIKYLLQDNPFKKFGLSNSAYASIDQRAVMKPSSTFIFGKSISYPGGYWFLYSLKEIFLEEVYKFESSSTSPLIIDCGANIGLSVIYFKKLFPGCRIIAYEPDTEVFRTLKKNLDQFDYAGIDLIAKAVWTCETELDFVSDGTLGGRIDKSLPMNKTVVKIKTERLKDRLKQKVDFLKLDIEGAEYEVLLDCSEELKNVTLLFFEYHRDRNKKNKNLEDILTVISEAGFRYYIRESYPIVRLPFVEKGPEDFFDLLLNVFCYRT